MIVIWICHGTIKLLGSLTSPGEGWGAYSENIPKQGAGLSVQKFQKNVVQNHFVCVSPSHTSGLNRTLWIKRLTKEGSLAESSSSLPGAGKGELLLTLQQGSGFQEIHLEAWDVSPCECGGHRGWCLMNPQKLSERKCSLYMPAAQRASTCRQTLA